MLDSFEAGESSYLPIYISASYYEKLPYRSGSIQEQMQAVMKQELKEYFQYLNQNPLVKPVLMLEGIREHIVSKVSPENVLFDLFKPFPDFNRITTIDVGLIKNRSRLKRVIPITGDDNTYLLTTHPVFMEEQDACFQIIDSILKLYQYNLSTMEVYQALQTLHYPTIDIFVVRLVATELSSSCDIFVNIAEMYEKMALTEVSGEEDKLFEISETMFRYIFDDTFTPDTEEYQTALWSLPHKHHTYLDFLLAYYVTHQIAHYKSNTDYHFFQVILTSNAIQFISAFLKDNYSLQETLLHFVREHFKTFDIKQKANGAGLLGKLTYNNLKEQAVSFLLEQYHILKKSMTQTELPGHQLPDYHFLCHFLCRGLILLEQIPILEEYVELILSNSLANAINRGIFVEYYGEKSQVAAHNVYCQDTESSLGETTFKHLIRKLSALSEPHTITPNHGQKDTESLTKGLTEFYLVTYLTLLQARIQNKYVALSFDILPYVEKAQTYLAIYQARPKNILSEKLNYYLEGIAEDINIYLTSKNFAIGPVIYNRYRNLKQIKRIQWTSHDIEDPESISEHTYSAWIMAMLFLPEKMEMEHYDKHAILDMLLIHDMAEAVMGDQVITLNEPKSALKEQNSIMRKLFLKGTYPAIANLSYFYDVWDSYYEDLNINAQFARDINLIQSVYTFCEYYLAYPTHFNDSDIEQWLSEKNHLNTEFGFELFTRLILNNTDFAHFIEDVSEVL